MRNKMADLSSIDQVYQIIDNKVQEFILDLTLVCCKSSKPRSLLLLGLQEPDSLGSEQKSKLIVKRRHMLELEVEHIDTRLGLYIKYLHLPGYLAYPAH